MSKNIVLCCDGTGQQFQDNKSNPLRLHYCLENKAAQTSFYDPGVGTFDPDGPDFGAGVFGGLASSVRREVAGGGLGRGIVRNIGDAYQYLMSVYREGDSVFLFGFSRGAFTARAVAGMLNKCGLLYPHNGNLLVYALRIYLQKGNARIAREFKSTMARQCKPLVVGVWDTVKSLGPHYDGDFFYGPAADNCDYGYQALSIDEMRSDFSPSLWPDAANIDQVWFPGVHGDVGGGYPEDGLANGALRWMLANARGHGLHLRDERVNEFQPNPAGVLHCSYEGAWKLRGCNPRQLPEGARIHVSALERRRQGAGGYDPANFPAHYDVVQNPPAAQARDTTPTV